MSKMEHDAGAARMRAGVSRFDKPWYRSCSDLLTKKHISKLRCLDLCCGNGEFSKILKEHHQMDVIGADYIPFHLENAKEEGFAVIPLDIDASAEQVDAIAKSHAGEFDIVVNLAAIEHIFNSDNLLRFAHTVLKPGGLLLVNTPNIGFLSYRIYSLFAGNRPAGEGHHVRFWDYRFLRTNLFLNGFSVTDDAREFYSLPQDAMLRTFRNKKRLASFVAWFFHVCRVMQYVPYFRSICCDELTVLARKDDVPVTGFELNTVQKSLDNLTSKKERRKAISRLHEARKRGWLNEHLYLSKLVDSLEM